jgi:uncharacterized radical SAM protein YgiQ
MTRAEMSARGWDVCDVILLTGDAYVDHPSYGVAVIARTLEADGYKVGIIAQPNWKDHADISRLGRPRLFFGVASGNVDSMIANYTANKRERSDDDFSAGGKSGKRPDRALTVYCNLIRQVYKDVPLVIGGIEASMRRAAHYDYWDDKVRRSVLLDTRADVLVYGMGERQIREIARRLASGQPASSLDGIRGTAVVRADTASLEVFEELPSFERIGEDKAAFVEAFKKTYANMNPFTAKPLVQPHANRVVIMHPPQKPLAQDEIDRVYEFPYARSWHPSYDKDGGVPGFETVRFSINSHRGCSGECSFCALYFHQGRIIQTRSDESIIREAELLAARSDFKGTITDVGGPSANMLGAMCARWAKEGFCANRKCLVPEPCKQYMLAYDRCIRLYRRIRQIPRVKHMFIGSGLRFDLLVDEKHGAYLKELCAHHISGLMKVAPEHGADEVLRLMHKPSFRVYERFVERFKETVAALGKKMYIVNYFIVAHPGADLHQTLKLALYLAKRGVCPEQIQDYIPTPMTYAACMYYTGIDPMTGKEVYVPRTFRERKMQRALLQYNKPENKGLIREALEQIGALHVFDTFAKGTQFSRPLGHKGQKRPPVARKDGNDAAPQKKHFTKQQRQAYGKQAAMSKDKKQGKR